MSLSKKRLRKSIPICIDKDDGEIVYYTESKNTDRMESKKGFEPYHYGDSVIYVSARRGAGKSTFCNMYIHNYVKATDGRVFLISRLRSDPSIKLPERGMRIPIKDLYLVEMRDMKDSLVVFDDISDAKLTKKEATYLNMFIIDIIENSRHFNVSVIITSHMMADYQKTRPYLYESSAVVIYPQFSNLSQIEKVMKNYYSLSDRQIDEIFNCVSRWVYISTIAPKYVLSQNEVYTYKYEK